MKGLSFDLKGNGVRHPAAWLAAVFLLGTCVWFRLGITLDHQNEQLSALKQQGEDLARLQTLRKRLGAPEAQAPRLTSAEIPSLVLELLANLGLPATASQGVVPGMSGSVPTLEIHLSGLSPIQVGQWCSAWQKRGAGWRVAKISWKTGIPRASVDAAVKALDGGPVELTILIIATGNS